MEFVFDWTEQVNYELTKGQSKSEVSARERTARQSYNFQKIPGGFKINTFLWE